MLLLRLRGATGSCTVLIGWLDCESPFKSERRTERSPRSSESNWADELAAHSIPLGVASDRDGSGVRAGDAQRICKSRRSGLRHAQSARLGRTDVARCPVGAWLELSFLELASPDLDLAHGGCPTVRKKSRWAPLYERAAAHPWRSPAVSADRTRHRPGVAKCCGGGTVCGAAFECRSGCVDLRA